MTGDVLARLEQTALHRIAAANLPGAVLHVVDSQGPRLTVVHGALNADTPVMLGSTSKAITAALLLQLVDDGLVRLDTPVTDYLPMVDLPRNVTVADLACHVSGLRTDATPQHFAKNHDRNFTYANQNYNLLGEVISAATQVPVDSLLSHRIFQPLGMHDSGCAPGERGSRGHTNLFGLNCPAPEAFFGPGSWIQAPSGGVVASARDVGRFLSMILSGGSCGGRQVMSARALDTMLNGGVAVESSPAVSDGLGESGRYGYGWVTKDIDGHVVHTHGGKVPQSTTYFGLVPDAGLGFVLVADVGDFLVRTPLLEELGTELIRVLIGLDTGELPTRSTARVRQTCLNAAYCAFLGFSAVGWCPPMRPRRVVGTLFYHLVLPVVLTIGLRRASQTPWRWLVRFAPDGVAVLLLGCLSMHLSGVERLASQEHYPVGHMMIRRPGASVPTPGR